MEPLIIKQSLDSPEIVLDKNLNKFVISGKSLAENPHGFYMPVAEWLDKYTDTPNEETVFMFKFEYFNSASARALANIFGKLEYLCLKGHKVVIEWYYKANDKDMHEAGQRFSEIFPIPFKYVAI